MLASHFLEDALPDRGVKYRFGRAAGWRLAL
jgi:hypothetical protein